MEEQNIDNLSQEELIKLEDDLVAAEVDGDGEAGESVPAAAEPEKTPEKAPEAEPKAEPKGDEGGEGGEGDKVDDGQPAAKLDDGKVSDPEPNQDDDLVKHVSPPSKWAEQRQKNRDLKTQLSQAQEKAAKADEMEVEVSGLKEKLEWLESAIKSKGIDIPGGPQDAFSDEKIQEVREEYGDELADMFKATAAVISKQTTSPAADKAAIEKPAADDKDPDGNGKPAPDTKPQEGDQVDADLLTAIDDNDELSYWRENSQPLWDRAVKMDNGFLKDPEYQKLSYPDRFKKVVELVKKDVTSGVNVKGDEGKKPGVPDSLSDTPGVVPSHNDNSALDKILATDDPNKQLEIYNGLPQSQRDEVDKSLNI